MTALIHRAAEKWCNRWVSHDCDGGIVDRFMCRMPSQPWFVRLSDWLLQRNDR